MIAPDKDVQSLEGDWLAYLVASCAGHVGGLCDASGDSSPAAQAQTIRSTNPDRTSARPHCASSTE